MRLGIDSTNFSQISRISGSLFHTSTTDFKIFSLVVQSRFCKRLLIMAQWFPIGAISGELPCHSITLMLFASKCLGTTLDVWHGARSCWRTQSPFGKCSWSWGLILLSITLRYLAEFIVPSHTCNRPVPCALKQPQNMTFSGCFTCWLI